MQDRPGCFLSITFSHILLVLVSSGGAKQYAVFYSFDLCDVDYDYDVRCLYCACVKLLFITLYVVWCILIFLVSSPMYLHH